MQCTTKGNVLEAVFAQHHGAGTAEVCQFHRVLVEKEVGGLNVSVNISFAVQEGQAAEHVCCVSP